ncbi:MAG: tRNA1(Val) (adenine(37)-N6)-methyltransferase [Saprospiraceae bacterium]|nr:tRNA1(Val) (adenine(37)-N6)-methyltransferase [Saprospiraceae bacterium]MCF8251637.1 tRNA1(Val) (adenine(37)-N6)-methyltransferase [Saprospiraceae bacterium]MCF8281358.1 tRNA1(Val) (adenine(37)-N6)-methyltransferase [Bacteroidales bacterium]MCF8312273.1 tRNA1(Val) (adenine(37)-N6)-methyltransferase [Saprospiraceae bacterium]MCF8441981.1 tRNA1(Val) (adenine(37)-N6)-methyltransferase [Saprospiraceae bacterium]
MQTISEVKPFQFKQFEIAQDRCTMKVGTDGVLLGAWSDTTGAGKILDIGSGTGLIAIMLAQRANAATIHAVEIDEEAAGQASENMKNSPWAEQLTCFHTSIQDFAKQTRQHYDLIVSNPPFFSGGTFSSSQDKNSVRHTIKLPHGDLLSAIRTLLAPGGRFCMVLPQMEGLRFREIAGNYGIFCSKMTEVIPKIGKPVERLLLQFELNRKPMEQSQLVIRVDDGPDDWTDAFRQLTGSYYLKM